MTAPQIIERALTFRFAQSVSDNTGTPDVLQISLTPLNDASSGAAGATFSGGVRTANVTLSDPLNVITFNLIPSYAPGLTAPILYRVVWRVNITSRTFTYDFSMPDADEDFDTLVSQGTNIIGGDSYLQPTDLGIPGRVARLNNAGIPETAAGDPVATQSDLTAINNEITAEVNAREAGDVSTRNVLQGALDVQIASTLQTAQAYTNNTVVSINGDISTERAARVSSDQGLQAEIDANNTTLTGLITGLTTQVTANTSGLTHKADLDGTGHVLVSQIPDAILTNAFPVADQTAMLAMSPSVVHKGSLAVRPDGVYLLTQNDPTQLANWVSLSTINSVNGKRGVVTLSAADVGAIPVGGSIAIGQVTGLATALGTFAPTTSVTQLATQVAGIQADPTLVHTTAGVIPSTLLDANMVYLNSVGQLVKKDGSIIPVSGGGGAVFSVNSKTGLVILTAADVNAIPVGGAVAQNQVTGLSTTLASKADLDGNSLVPAAQIPTLTQGKITGLSTALGLKADLVSGLIPLSEIPAIPQTGVTGLSSLVAGNQFTNTTNAINRIASLEAQVAAGGSGGGGGVTTTAPFYTSSNTSSAVLDFSQVNLHSPWGIDSDGTITGTVGTWYYLFTGVRGTDVAYPFVSANGHLNLRKWNETGPADPVYALASDVTTLTTTVGTKANQTDLTSLVNTVATKANQAQVTALSSTVDTKANTADLNSTNTAVAGKANQSDFSTLQTVVTTKANQTDLTALQTTVAGKANQTDLSTLSGTVAANATALAAKADLVNGVLRANEIPTGIPQASIAGLPAALVAKADLVNSLVPIAQLPNIPQSQVTGLGTALGSKADLVNGYIPLSQIPAAALPNVQIVANRAAMLALTLAQVQYGDFAIITATADAGTYVLTGNDPSQFSNWTEFVTPPAPVTSVNSQVGDVVLTATQVGALPSNAAIPQSQITGLVSALGSFATTAALQTGLAGKVAPADVQAMFYLSSMVKRADYVATAPISSLAGQQSVDGVLVPLGALVLVTAQSSSVNNGLWQVNTGVWTRPADFATGSFLSRDTVVVVANSTGSANGANNSYTIWQEANNSGFIDTSANNWVRIAYCAPPFTPIGGNGISVAGQTFSVNVQANGGVLATSQGLALDPNVGARVFRGTIPGGSTVAAVTHNLNTTSPQISIWDTASNVLQLAGVTVTSPNAISIEFANAPATGQYRVCVVG